MINEPYFWDSEVDQTIVLDANGVLTSFTDGTGLPPRPTTTIGTSAGSSEGNDGIIAWGRWAGGTTGGDGRFSGANLDDLDSEGPMPMHYIVGVAATNLPPFGTMATYSMIGATTPSIHPFSSITSASVTSSTLEVHFGAGAAFLNVGFNVNGSAVTGNMIFLDLNGARFSGSGFVSGSSFCGNLSAAGFLAGQGGVRAGLAYVVNDFGFNAFNGAIAYQRGAVAPSNYQPPQ